MNAEIGGEAASTSPPLARWRAGLRHVENFITAAALAAMVVMLLVEIVLRKGFHTGIGGSSAIVQHLVLVVGLMGGAIAAREGRLLSLSTVPMMLKGRWKTAAAVFSSAIAAAVSLFLCTAGIELVKAEREGGNIIAYNVPVWVAQSIIPIAFALVTWRLVRSSSETWKTRGITALLTAAFVLLAWKPPIAAEKLMIPALVLLGIATVLGSPVFTTLGGAAAILFWGHGDTIASLPLDNYKLVTNATLPSIPLFTLAGYFLASGGASKRLVRVFLALFGAMRGGPAIVTCVVCAFFTTFTGASGVTILALGGPLLPILLSAGYKEKHALGLITGSGSLGLLFPPCLPLMLFAIWAKGVEVQQIFLAGILPGCVMVLVTAALGVWLAPRNSSTLHAFKLDEAGDAVWDAKWELLLPVVALVGLFGGFATPVETAAITAFYAFIVETFVYRDLKFRGDTARVLTECGLLIGGVLIILGVAQGFTNFLVDAEVPAHAVDWVRANIHEPWVFLLMLNLFLLIVGSLMDIFSAIIVVVPLIVPMGQVFGISPLHLGIIFLANLELGYMMPPVGMNLVLASYRFRKPVPEVYRAILPMLGAQFAGVLLITYVPAFTEWLPKLFAK
ncbi:MAG: TRAP transporter large permease subunit [Verrucomicrobia bacterium]|nr:TRAP transporter large permease subunit [Verrucomicrobiota bacterium]